MPIRKLIFLVLPLFVACSSPKSGDDRADTGVEVKDVGPSPDLGEVEPDMGPDLDVGIMDAEVGGDADAGPPPPRPSIYGVTGGGGAVRSAGFRARISIGAPSPAGATQSPGFRAVIGPPPTTP